MGRGESVSPVNPLSCYHKVKITVTSFSPPKKREKERKKNSVYLLLCPDGTLINKGGGWRSLTLRIPVAVHHRFRPMKLVHLIQLLLFGVVVFGRAIQEQIADASVVTDDADQLPYRFRYNVANPISGDYKSQSESRDGDGVVTGMYKVLQPDGCVRVVHYTADAMGFHPTVTYEGDCKRAVSINKAGQAQSTDSAISMPTEVIATAVHSSSDVVSSPVYNSVSGSFISPAETGGHVPAGPGQDLSSPMVGAQSEKLELSVGPTLSPTKASEIDRLWQTLGGQQLRSEITTAGSVPALTSTENVVKTGVESEEIKVESPLPEALPIATEPPVTVSKTANDGVQPSAAAPLAVPSVLTGEVETFNLVPDSIASLLQSFDPVKTVDPLGRQPSQFSERTLKTEPDSSVTSPAVEDPAVINDVEVAVASDGIESELSPEVSTVPSDETVPAETTGITAQSKSVPQPEDVKDNIDDSADDFTLQTKADDTVEPKIVPNDSAAVVPSDEKETGKERTFGTLAHSALANVQNLTAPLTQLISSSLPNLTNPVTVLLNTFNKNKSTSTIAPSTFSPVTEAATIAVASAAKIDAETEDVAGERTIVTHHHNSEAFTGTEGVVSDLPVIAEDSQPTISEGPSSVEAEQASWREESAEQTVEHKLESVSVDINDSAVLGDSVPATDLTRNLAEPALAAGSDVPLASATIVYDSLPAVVEGDAFESYRLAGLERQPTEQVQVDVQDTSSLFDDRESGYAEADPAAKDNAESYYDVTPVLHAVPQSYASYVDPVPVIYSKLQIAPFYVHQPTSDVSPHAHPAPVRQSTARSVDSVAAMPYGARVHAFVPNYATVGKAPPAYVYNQHRRHGQLYRRLHYVPQRRLVPAAPVRSSKKGEAYGMRYAAVQASPMKSRYAVRLPAVKQPTPFYSTYVY